MNEKPKTVRFMLRNNRQQIVPDCLIPLLNKYPPPKNRYGEIIEWIDKNSITIGNSQRISDTSFFKNNADKLYHRGDEPNIHFGWNSKCHTIADVIIVEIDTSRKNIIVTDTFTQSECLRQLDCIDENINLWT